MSVVPVICENQQCHNVQGDGQRSEWELNCGEIVVVGHTVGWRGITDQKVMEGRESKMALQAI